MAQQRKDIIELGMTKQDMGLEYVAKLEMETSKHYSGGISSGATVFWHGEHSRQHAMGLSSGDCGDYSHRGFINKTSRATQGNIDKQHAVIFTPGMRAQIEAEARAWYARQQASKAA
jgi:hypothetical protein